jgi:hypothetical protein
MHFLFNLLRSKGLYMFQALLGHPQEEIQKRHLVYCVRVMSVYQDYSVPFQSWPYLLLLLLRARQVKPREHRSLRLIVQS